MATATVRCSRWAVLLVVLLSSTVSRSMAADREALAHAKYLSRAFRSAAEAASPSVVTIISTYKLEQNSEMNQLRELLNDPRFRRMLPDQLPFQFPDEGNGRGGQVTHIGSGVIIDAEGIVLTNSHVVDKADGVLVRLPDGSEHKATEIRSDYRSDLAILKIRPEPEDQLRAAPLGDSASLSIGDWVIAIGSPFELEATVSAGIISAKGRSIRRIERARLLQTDAAINPGNSGGPLVNLDAEVIGINTAIATNSGGYQGVGFAIPINQAKWVARELLEHGEVRRAWLGIEIGDLTAEAASEFGLRARSGVWVVNVREDGPADLAGVEKDDVIVEFGGIPVRAMGDLQAAVEQQPIGSQQRMSVMREGERISLEVQVSALPQRVRR